MNKSHPKLIVPEMKEIEKDRDREKEGRKKGRERPRELRYSITLEINFE